MAAGDAPGRLSSICISGATWTALRAALLAAALSLGLGLALAAAVRAQEAAPCRDVRFEGEAFKVCEADLRRDVVRLFWHSAGKVPYAYLSALPKSLPAPRATLAFATNAGMFSPTYKPVGLYVENGKQVVPASTRAGYGNFHMRPNGIFYVAGDKAGVLETHAYLKQAPRADIATQSGPMLVINGKLHPRFRNDSDSLKRRNGVGVRNPNTVVFAISDREVTFATFARLFRDQLKCANALFLDGGSVPSLLIPAEKRGGNLLPLGPMLGVYRKDK